jgi:hypothetical protein
MNSEVSEEEEVEEEEEENLAVGKSDFLNIFVHVYDKEIKISVGDATQRLKWLAHVAIARWDEENCQGWKKLGIPTSIRSKSKDGEEIDLNAVIRDSVENCEHVFITTSLSPLDTN